MVLASFCNATSNRQWKSTPKERAIMFILLERHKLLPVSTVAHANNQALLSALTDKLPGFGYEAKIAHLNQHGPKATRKVVLELAEESIKNS